MKTYLYLMGYSIISLIVGCNSKTQSNTKSTSFGFGNTSYSLMNPNQSAQTVPQGQECFLGVFNGSEGIYANSAGTNYHTNETVPNGFCPVLTFNTPQNAIPDNYNYATQTSPAVPTCLFDANQKVVYYSTGTQPTYKSPLRSPGQYNQVCAADFKALVGAPIASSGNYQGDPNMGIIDSSSVNYAASNLDYSPDRGVISPDALIQNSGVVGYTRSEVNGFSNKCVGAIDPKVQEGKDITYDGSGATKTFIYDRDTNTQLIIDYTAKKLYFNIARGANGTINQCSVPITYVKGLSQSSLPARAGGCNPERFVRAHAPTAFSYMGGKLFAGCVLDAALECTFGDSSNKLTLMHSYLPGAGNQCSLTDKTGDCIRFNADLNKTGITTIDSASPGESALSAVGNNKGQCNNVAALNSILNLGTVYFYSDLY